MQARLNFGLLLTVLLFWGWQTEMLWLGLLLVFIIFAVLLAKGRYSFDTSSFFQIADLCALIALATFAFLWVDDKASKAVYPTLALLPVALLPLLLIQLLDKKQQLPLSALMFLKRKLATTWFDITPFFVVICLFSAGTSKPEQLSYFTGVILFLLALLLVLQYQVRLLQKFWMILMFITAGSLALLMQWTLVDLQKQLEESINQWLLSRHHTSQSSTAIGEVGRLKLSDEIVFRVKLLGERQKSMLLRQGSYLRYAKGSWFGGSWVDKNVPFEVDAWQLQPSESNNKHQLRVYQSFARSRATLVLPAHPTSIQGLAADSVTIQQGGSVLVKGIQPFAAFDVFYGGAGSLLEHAKESDLRIPKAEAKAVAKVARDLDLYQLRYEQGDQAVLNALNSYFLGKYTYSTWLKDAEGDQSPLSQFLSDTHSGHCEYFATATVLLLREVGIPSRYAVGYSMQEWDADAQLYLVRGRDAHAWALAQIDGVWQNVDNTPPNWFGFEDQDRSAFQDLKDLWSDLMFTFKKWRYSESEDNDDLWLALLLVLFSVLAWRVLRRVKVEQQHTVTTKEAKLPTSDWLLLEQDLVEAGYIRLKGESLTTWLKRIQKEELLPLVSLYYQQRFGGVTFNSQQITEFESSISSFRQQLQANSSSVKITGD